MTGFRLTSRKHAVVSDFWPTGEGHGSLGRREAEVNMKWKCEKGGNVECDLWDPTSSCSLHAAGLFGHHCDATTAAIKHKLRSYV